MFKKAERKKAKLRLALCGPSGSGKTMGALLTAQGLGGKIAVIDTERGSASLYSDLVPFDVLELGPPYSPERYIEAIEEAERSGYDILVLDSITHEWSGQGGILEIIDNVAKTRFKGNSHAAWSEGNPRHQRFIDAMLHSGMHIIATMRAKTEALEGEENGKRGFFKATKSIQQRDGIEYEFTAVLDLSVQGNLAIKSKDRMRLFNDPMVLSPKAGQLMLDWLESGEEDPLSKPYNLGSIEGVFAHCQTVDDLTVELKALAVPTGHPRQADIGRLYKERKAQIEAGEENAPDNEDGLDPSAASFLADEASQEAANA